MGKNKKGKKYKSIKEMQEELKKPLKIRTGVIHTKIVPDKTKYSRKKKRQEFWDPETD